MPDYETVPLPAPARRQTVSERWTLADYKRHVPRIIAERDEALARADHNAIAVNENADMIVTLRAEADDLRRQMLNETYRPEGGEIVLRELRRTQRERDEAAAKIAAVEALIDHARKISPSPSMHVYVGDLERALGMDAPRPHKTGGKG